MIQNSLIFAGEEWGRLGGAEDLGELGRCTSFEPMPNHHQRIRAIIPRLFVML
jgi:hypothetical protein